MKLPKAYEPQQYESTIYGLWETSGVFSPSGVGQPYSITLPPPNANGNLHIGHALTVALQDVLIRYYRMQGRDTLYLPGADHAGFETWVVYEKQLEKEGKSRFDFSREQLYSQVWDFVEKQRGNMEIQLRELGASLSWDHMTFTLDEKVITTVYDTFKKLWDDKLIYRGERIVNFCTRHQTSFADIEVVHKMEKSKLWKIAYPLVDGAGEIIVATTRPETILGDVAIAVHPEDARYKKLIGSKVWLPLMEKEIPIVGDDAVDPKFGTGAVKVTPAHDPVDFEIGQRHKLPMIQVIGFDGKMTANVPPQFQHLPVDDARKRVLAALEASEFLRGEDDYEHNVGHCYKCDTTIQPLVKEQWFLKVRPLADRAKAAIASGDIKFTPASKGRLVMQYLDNFHDWNLSRQIPWGIPIPAFQNVHDHDDWIFDDRVEKKEITVNGKTYQREEDTFDTWFSSGQWPFITTDYLTGGELQRFYPNSLMETGHDILFPWVARMMMLGLYATDTVPFKDVYLHGLVLDEKGQKMSKSKGNVVNPIDIVEQYGSDALRMGIIASRSAGLNQAFHTSKVIAARNFANKIWNIARYIEDKVGDEYKRRTPSAETIADHWVLRQLSDATTQIDRLLANYRFAEAYEVLYHTIWDDVADWYIEASKLSPNLPLLAWVLETSLKLAHPFAPFVTEAIWETLKWEDGMLITATWPKATTYHDISAAEFEQVQRLVSESRFVSSELGSARQTLIYENDLLIADQKALIQRLANLKEVKHVDQAHGLRLAVPNREAWLEIDQETLYEHQTKLELRLSDCREQIKRLQARLDNPSYLKSAPEKVVTETRQQLDEQKELESRLVRELEVLAN
ncbi:MAG TPA: valine--tRNA ligase [Candidatus Saccharimonadales bacterium]|jgi:valyl-tRNA synthetase|nr:valine--tRNA ligase [Candidatus Saccharimonadales bacterium]